jgi:hypothetical protein
MSDFGFHFPDGHPAHLDEMADAIFKLDDRLSRAGAAAAANLDQLCKDGRALFDRVTELEKEAERGDLGYIRKTIEADMADYQHGLDRVRDQLTRHIAESKRNALWPRLRDASRELSDGVWDAMRELTR